MGGIINSIKTSAISLHASLTASTPGVWSGVAGYKDIDDDYAYRLTAPIQAMTSATVASRINTWFAQGGGDTPEANLYALTQVAVGTGAFASNWRSKSIKMMCGLVTNVATTPASAPPSPAPSSHSSPRASRSSP
ncbi:hypothetical protein FOA52_000280 [Chlamydomonas sp. UWO 241]|nr:hypothetical protein FOA52_000280 [Chlamydomonas sp. UWO 241]